MLRGSGGCGAPVANLQRNLIRAASCPGSVAASKLARTWNVRPRCALRITPVLLLFFLVLVTAGAWAHVVRERQPQTPLEKYAAATRGDCSGLDPCYGCFKQLEYDPTGSGRHFRVSYMLTARVRAIQYIRL